MWWHSSPRLSSTFEPLSGPTNWPTSFSTLTCRVATKGACGAGGGGGARAAGRVRLASRVVRRKRAVSCVRAIEGEGAGGRAHPNEQVVVRRLEIARDVNVVGELVFTWGGGGARCGARCGAREQRGFGAHAGALLPSVGV